MRFIASNKYMFFVIMLMVLVQQLITPAIASVQDDSHLCVYATQKYEKAFNIKPHLLTTISHVETGRFDIAKKTSKTWPWTVNFKGKGMYFDTKKEAVAKVKSLQKKGYKSIDVGCMQVNLMYHGQAFDSVEDAFDVDKNVFYAASFLTKLYENADNSWDKATMHYHSKKASRGERYKKKVDELLKIVKDLNQEYKFLSRAIPSGNAWRQAKLEEYRKNKRAQENI